MFSQKMIQVSYGFMENNLRVFAANDKIWAFKWKPALWKMCSQILNSLEVSHEEYGDTTNNLTYCHCKIKYVSI